MTALPTDDVDGMPVTRHEPGDALPGGARAWERLGVGHRCETWLAWDTALWCPVVVKFPRPHQSAHPRARATLRRETSALAGAAHPNLPTLLLDGTAAEIPYLVFAHLDGDPLDAIVDDDGAFDADDVALLGTQLLAAVRTLHARGIAHLDIKTENVVLARARPVLIDLGSARRLGARQPSGAPIGSSGYAAPELEAGDPISSAMDVYGVGVTLHELITGEPAFDPHLDAADRPAPPELPACELGRLVTAMLAADPSDRPDVGTVLAGLGAVARGARDPWPDWASVLLGR